MHDPHKHITSEHTTPLRGELAGLLGARRRGTFLIFVIGVLALLSVITVSYVAVGTSDRATVATLRQRQDFDRIADETLDYILKIPTDDLFLGSAEPTTFGLVPSSSKAGGIARFYQRETTDYPSTSEKVVSIGAAQVKSNTDALEEVLGTFNPAGADNTDPWLASPEPTWLMSEFPGKGQFSPNLITGAVPHAGVGDQVVRANDWAHISNVSPSGMYANLYYLRNITGGIRNFDRTPNALAFTQVSLGPDASREEPLLTLTYDLEVGDRKIFVSQGNLPSGSDPYTPIRGFINSGSDPIISPEKPVTWSRWQVGAARPMIAQAWDSSDAFQYQWADADGDGIADSRWFELAAPVPLVDDSNPNRIIFGVLGFNPLVSDPGDMRWFAAVRIVDLSGRVNVNTASEFRRIPTNPSEVLPVGLTPADVDLRRMLTMQDFLLDANGHGYSDSGSPALGYNLLRDDPLIADPDLLYSEYTDPAEWAVTGELGLANIRSRLSTNNGYFAGNPLTQDDRLFMGFVTGPASVRLDPQFVPDPYGLTSLKELLTYNGLNDAANLSPLETATTSINQSLAVPGADTLRAGRSLDAELARWAIDTSERPDVIFDELEQDTIARFINPRPRITPVSGSRELRQRVYDLTLNEVTERPYGSGDPIINTPITEADLRIDAPNWLEKLDRLNPNPNINPNDPDDPTHRLFYGYAEALAPYSWIDNAWRSRRQNYDTTAVFTPGPFNFATLFYGHAGPELALLTAAHMTANLIDMYDDDPGDPDSTFFTLKLSDQSNGDLSKTGPGERWYYGNRTLDLSAYAKAYEGLNTNDPRAGRLAPSNDRTVSPAVNVYGVEIQPVITRAGVFAIFTDAPDSIANVDSTESNDYMYDGNGIQCNNIIGLSGNQVIIDTTRSAVGNPDFLGEVFAVQLHNPFDEPIDLTDDVDGDGTEEPVFYIEFGGSFFAVCEVPFTLNSSDGWKWSALGPADLITNKLTLRPGETRVFLGYAEDPQRYQDNFKANYDALFGKEYGPQNLNGITPASILNIFDSFVRTQFSTTYQGSYVGPATMAQYNPTNGEPLQNPISTDGGVRTSVISQNQSQLNAKVLLWKRRFAGTAGESVTSNFIENDQLIDRLALPAGQTLSRTYSLSPLKMTTLGQAGPDPTDGKYCDGNKFNDASVNKGLTFMSWAVAGRPNAASTALPSPSEGLVEPFMIENKLYNGMGTSLNSYAQDKLSGLPTPSDMFDTLWDFIDEAVNLGSNPDNPSAVEFNGVDFTKRVDQLSTNTLFATSHPDSREFWNANTPWARATDEIQMPRDPSGSGGDDSYFTQKLDVDSDGTDELLTTMRLTDLLLPIGVGPRMDPYAITPNNTSADTVVVVAPGANSITETEMATRLDQLDRAWLTLPEALALAMGYYDDPHGRGTSFPDPSFQLGREKPGTATRTNYYLSNQTQSNYTRAPLGVSTRLLPAALDRLHLRLDAFVPFVDVVTTAGAAGYDGRFYEFPPADQYNGVAPAVSDIRAFTGAPLALAVMDQFSTQGYFEFNKSGAAIAVRRGPGSLTERVAGRVNINTAPTPVLRAIPMLSPLSRFDADGVSGPQWWWDTTTGQDQHDDRSDVAATIAAYRDKRVQFTRPGSNTSGPNATDGRGIDFRDIDESGYQVQTIGDFKERAELLPVSTQTGRQSAARISGLREQPGFASLGEMLAARLGFDGAQNAVAATHGIDRLALRPVGGGANPTSIDQPGVDIRYDRNATDDGIPNDYDEQLAIAAAALNSSTVSSDVFACWFILHGYTAADTLGLAPEDPLVPTVARRYLCVFDRSNVTKPSDRPNVLLFQEVPIANVRVRNQGEASDASGKWDWPSY